MRTIRTELRGQVFICLVVAVASLVAIGPAATQEPGGRRPEPSPGSIPAEDGAERYHLSHTSFDEALNHYTRVVGDPMSMGHDPASGHQWAVFAYRSEPQSNQTTRYTCVRIREGNPDNAVPSVLRELRGAVHYGYLTRERYDQIAAEYASVSELFFRSSEEFGGPERTMDGELSRRYTNFVRIGMWLEPQIIQEEMMRIARSGDQDALDELKKMLMPDIERVQELQTTAAIVDHWVECLNGIRALAETDGFRLEIDLEHSIVISDHDKG